MIGYHQKMHRNKFLESEQFYSHALLHPSFGLPLSRTFPPSTLTSETACFDSGS